MPIIANTCHCLCAVAMASASRMCLAVSWSFHSSWGRRDNMPRDHDIVCQIRWQWRCRIFTKEPDGTTIFQTRQKYTNQNPCQ